MSQYLSYSKFKCLNHKEIDKFDVNEINENNSHLSKYCNSIVNKDGMKIGCVKKLVPSLGNKSKYVHRILKFK